MNDNSIFVGQGEAPVFLLLSKGNRHGLIAGATGTGKTISLQVLAEGFSQRGVPVFLADVKGDLSGLCQSGEPKPKLLERARQIGLTDYTNSACPVIFWDLFGEQGHPVRATVSDMGPVLLARLLELNDTQEGVLNLTFKVADDEGLLLLDMKDLRAMLQHVADNAKTLTQQYGNVSSASVGSIQRQLLVLEQQGADQFFGEPALRLSDLMRRDLNGRGYVSVLAADRLMQRPRLYSTFLLWLLSELFEQLPEVGDLDQPKLVFFFDEAHLLFDDAPKALVSKVEQVVRLVRSKGVGVYFISQNPLDIPDAVLGQLGNRIQHALRAFTPKDQRAVKAAAETFRENPSLSIQDVITELGVGEALASMLDDQGSPGIVQRTLVRPPSSRIGPADPSVRQSVFAQSPVSGVYDQTMDRESAYERLISRVQQPAQLQSEALNRPSDSPRRASGRQRQGPQEILLNAAIRSIGTQLGGSFGRQLVRGLFGTLFKG
ncbi:MAG: DUF853 domain-containing protein [Armatimonadetes bacterium]|nr:DUF853 domain-containing protein [Armatimonadota bacterium]